LFVPENGNVFVCADYGQMQLRIAAELSGDARLLRAYELGEDVHRLTAAGLLGKQPAEITSEERALAKAIGFGMLFGMGAAGLRRYAMSNYGVRLTESEAKRMIERFFENYPDLYMWRRAMADQANAFGSVSTPLGRVRNFVAEGTSNTYTAAMNTPIQGGEAEVMLSALGRLPSALAPYKAFPVNCIHDELLVECAAEQAPAVIEAVRDAMEHGMLDVFPRASLNGLVEIASGLSWADAK
jgi:DNA polymerase-1